ncbi:hypothetical protein K523DRAFT_48254 [Schizophyllum commune Tattone D]|nr:hypothetical protein K523DRAFT_48254 [Schizophyllum commune Tattone D]
MERLDNPVCGWSDPSRPGARQAPCRPCPSRMRQARERCASRPQPAVSPPGSTTTEPWSVARRGTQGRPMASWTALIVRARYPRCSRPSSGCAVGHLPLGGTELLSS